MCTGSKVRGRGTGSPSSGMRHCHHSNGSEVVVKGGFPAFSSILGLWPLNFGVRSRDGSFFFFP